MYCDIGQDTQVWASKSYIDRVWLKPPLKKLQVKLPYVFKVYVTFATFATQGKIDLIKNFTLIH